MLIMMCCQISFVCKYYVKLKQKDARVLFASSSIDASASILSGRLGERVGGMGEEGASIKSRGYKWYLYG